MQATLYGLGVVAVPPTVQTGPPVFLSKPNDLPTTEPTYIAHVPPAPPRPAPPEYEPPGTQVTLDYFLTRACPFCHSVPDSLEKHYLLDHPDEVNDRLARLLERKRDRHTPEPRAAPRSTPLAATGPVMFGEVRAEKPTAQNLDPENPRECNDCGTVMSKDYARVFGHEDGTLYCPDCRPRSARYSNDPTYGTDHRSNPSTVTGSSNPRSHANPHGPGPGPLTPHKPT